MWVYTLRRCLVAVPTVLGVLAITFVLFRLLPGDAAERALDAHADPAALADLRRSLGLDLPLWPDPLAWAWDCQFTRFAGGILRGDLGVSWQTWQPVAELIRGGLLPSMSLTVPIFVGHQLAGLACAVIAASRRGSAVDLGITAAAVTASHLPVVALIAAGQWLFAFQLGLFPIHGWSGPQHLVLPVLLGVIAGSGGHARFYRTLLVDEAGREYVRCARAKGVDGMGLIVRHVLPNVLVPVSTRVAMEIPHLVLGSLLLERFFGIPGLGSLLVDAVVARDLPVLAAMTALGAVLVVAGTLAGDIACHLLTRRGATA